MVLTRNQEAVLKKQYKVDEEVERKDGEPATPVSTVKRQKDGTILRSALKTKFATDRPWEEHEKRMKDVMNCTSKRVTINSNNNTVFEFQRSTTSFEDDSDGEGGDLSSIKRQLNLGEVEYEEEGNRRRPGDSIIAFLMLFLWSASSSWLTVVMQKVLRDERRSLPLMIPGISQLTSSLIVRALGVLGIVSISAPPTLIEYVWEIIPLSCSAALCMYLGNYAYVGLSLSFLSILKALTPAVTLIMGAMAGLEQFSIMSLVSTLMIAYGTGVATVDEASRAISFHWPSFISFTSSVLFESARMTFVSKALKGRRKSSFDVLAYAGPVTFLFMTGASMFVERNTILRLTADDYRFFSSQIILIVVLSFVVNISSYGAIKYTSSTTVKVVGSLKNLLVMWLGILQGDVVSFVQWQGFFLSTAGFIVYTRSRRLMAEKGTYKTKLA